LIKLIMPETKQKKQEDNKYIEAVGRRKTSVARVRLTPSSKMSYVINGKNIDDYFPTDGLRLITRSPFDKSKISQKFSVSVLVRGGGSNSQAEAIRHGISRVLVEHDAELRKILKKSGFLKRDSRTKERKKFGL